MASNSARRFSPKLISIAVASCFASSTALANPTGPTVVSGQVSFQQTGNLLQVTNSPSSIINWQTFSIGANEITRFIQQSASSAVLNRVTGVAGNINPSIILGAMQSNGRVMLINPNGITFGAGAQIDVAGLVASSLNLSDTDFLANRLRFTDGAGAGSVVNLAKPGPDNQNAGINAAAGGQVYLVGSSVTNSGVITTPQGEVVLAAGNTVELVNPGTPNLRVEIAAPDNQAVNLGRIVADAGRVGIYAGLVRQGGTIRADGVQMTDDGRIVLKATKNVTVEAGSVTSASGPKGGTVDIQSGDTTLVFGDVSATGSADVGGTVRVLGNQVGVMGDATIDASGATGGGTVLVGGDFQGKNPAVQNAYRTIFGSDATIKADATVNGDGGKVIVWSDDGTRAYGTISARGGPEGGDGGFVEVSGKRWLDFHAKVDTRAPRGKTGTLLLDPNDVEIVSCCGAEGGFSGGGESPWIWTSDSGDTSQVAWGDAEQPGTIIGNLQNNNVIITTSGPGEMAGDITFFAGATYSSSNFLTFTADRDIHIQTVSIVNDGTGDINFFAGRDITAGFCVLCVGGATVTTGGNLVLSANRNIDIQNSALTAGYSSNAGRDAVLTVQAGGNINIAFSTLVAQGGNVDCCDLSKGGNGIVDIIANGNIDILESTIQGFGGYARTEGGLGQVAIDAGGYLRIDNSETESTFIQALGGHSNGSEGASGGAGRVLLAGGTEFTLRGGAMLEAIGGDSSSGVGGLGQVAIFGGAVTIQADSCCNTTIYAEGGFGEGHGGTAQIGISGSSVLIAGSTAIEAAGGDGDGSGPGGPGQIAISGGSVTIAPDCCQETLYARGGTGQTIGGAGSISIAGGSILIDGAEGGILALGGHSHGTVGGNGVISIGGSGTASVIIRNNSNIMAAGGSTDGDGPGGNASIAITATGDIFSLDSHIEAEGGPPGGHGVVAMTSFLRGITIDGSGASEDTTVRAESGGSGGGAEVTLDAFDIISVNQDRVEVAAGEGGLARILLHFTGRSSGGWFVNNVETPNPPVGNPPQSPIAQVFDHGFFVNGEPALLGVNFFVTYSGSLPDPCQISPEICSPPRPEPPDITDATDSVGTSRGDKDSKKKEPICSG